MMRPSGVLTRFMPNTDYQLSNEETKQKTPEPLVNLSPSGQSFAPQNRAAPARRKYLTRAIMPLRGSLVRTQMGRQSFLARVKQRADTGGFRLNLVSHHLSLTPACMHPDLRLLYGGSSDFLGITSSGATDGIAVIIDLNPATGTDMRIYIRRCINHVCVCFRRCSLSSQIEVDLSGFAHLRLGINDRCFDLPID